jgi:hypothetical protein
VVRKALARDPEDRYQNAGDLGDALSQVLFSRRMKVTARDIAALVKDTQVEMMRKRSAEPKDSLIDALILDEMQKMTSLLGAEGQAAKDTGEGSSSLDPSSFVDTSAWVGELGMASAGGGAPSPPAMKARQPNASRPPVNKPKPMATPAPGEIESLEHLLEPDRTGLHKKGDEKGPPWAIIIVVMLVIAAGAAIAIVVAMQ